MYHDRDQRSKDVNEIATLLSLPKEAITAKWNILRAQYGREYLETKPKTGAAASSCYTSKWKYFAMLKFLTGAVEARKSSDNLAINIKKEIDEDTRDTDKQQPKRRIKDKNIDIMKTELLTKTVEALTAPSEPVNMKSSYSNDTFAAYIAHKLSSYTSHQIALAEKKTSDVLFDLEMSSFGTVQHWSPSSTYFLPGQTPHSSSSSGSSPVPQGVIYSVCSQGNNQVHVQSPQGSPFSHFNNNS